MVETAPAGRTADRERAATPAAPNVWLIVVVLSLGTFATGTDAFLTTGVLPRLTGDLHISAGRAGQLVTVFAWVYGLGSPILMTLTGRIARKRLLVGAIALFGLCNLAVLVLDSFGSLLLTRILAACFAAVYVPGSAVVAAMIAPAAKRGRALALVIGGSSLATVLGVPAGIWISDLFDSWRAAFVFVAGLSAAAFVAVLVLLPDVPTPPRVGLASRFGVLRRWNVLSVLLVTALGMTGGFTLFTYLAPIMSGVAPLGSGRLEWLIFAFGVASLLGSWLSGIGSDRVGSYRVVAVALVVLIVNFVFFDFAIHTLPGAVLTMAIWGVAGWGFMPAQQHRLVQLSPENPNIVISLNSSALYLGIAFGSLIGGSLVDRFDTGVLRWFAVGLDLAALGLSLAAGPFARPKGSR